MNTKLCIIESGLVLLVGLCGAGTGFAQAAASTPGPVVKMPGLKDYTISYWWGPPPGQSTERRYKEVADAGITVANMAGPEKPGDYWPMQDKEMNLRILGLCQKFGMKHIVSDTRMLKALAAQDKSWEGLVDAMVADYKDHPALYGYYVIDEPNTDSFPRLGEIAARLRAKDPAHIAFINLFPDYASPEILKAKSYRDYLERYVKEVKPAFICYDHYHFLKGERGPRRTEFANQQERDQYEAAYQNLNGGVDRRGFFNNLEVVRDVAREQRLPFCVIVLVTTHGPYRDLTEAELRWEAFQTLAYGSSGLFWFTYWAPPDEKNWHFHHAAFEFDGRVTDHYAQLKRINADVRMLGGKLEGRASTGVFHVGSEPENVKKFEGFGPVKSIAGGRLSAGFFDGGYVLLASKNYNEPIHATLSLEGGSKVWKLDKSKGKEKRIKAQGDKVTVDLQPGDAELLRIR